METVIIILIWLFSLAAYLLLPVGIIALLCAKVKRRGIRAVCVVLVLLLSAGAVLAADQRTPVVVADGAGEVNEACYAIVESMGTGFYFRNVPFLAVLKVIRSAKAPDDVVFDTYYFPFGRTRLSHGRDGFELLKPLTGWTM